MINNSSNQCRMIMAVSTIPRSYPDAVTINNHVTLQESAQAYDFEQVGNTITFFLQGENKARAENQTIFTIDTGYRPKRGMYFVGTIGTTPCIFTLGTNGACSIYLAASYTSGRVYISGTYAI